MNKVLVNSIFTLLFAVGAALFAAWAMYWYLAPSIILAVFLGIAAGLRNVRIVKDDINENS